MKDASPQLGESRIARVIEPPQRVKEANLHICYRSGVPFSIPPHGQDDLDGYAEPAFLNENYECSQEEVHGRISNLRTVASVIPDQDPKRI